MCEINPDDCLSNPCLVGETCEDGLDEATCSPTTTTTRPMLILATDPSSDSRSEAAGKASKSSNNALPIVGGVAGGLMLMLLVLLLVKRRQGKVASLGESIAESGHGVSAVAVHPNPAFVDRVDNVPMEGMLYAEAGDATRGDATVSTPLMAEPSYQLANPGQHGVKGDAAVPGTYDQAVGVEEPDYQLASAVVEQSTFDSGNVVDDEPVYSMGNAGMDASTDGGVPTEEGLYDFARGADPTATAEGVYDFGSAGEGATDGIHPAEGLYGIAGSGAGDLLTMPADDEPESLYDVCRKDSNMSAAGMPSLAEDDDNAEPLYDN